MALKSQRSKAILLRRQGMTYGAIKKRLRVAKSTLSEWLRDVPLSQDQMALLVANKKMSREVAIEKTRIVKSQKRQYRLSMIYDQERKRLLPLDQRTLEIAGLFLYWGEGNKSTQGSVIVNNTDPLVVKFYLYWLIKVLEVSKERVRVGLQLYTDMDKKKEMNYWSTMLHLPLSQFQKPYIKKSLRTSVDHKGYGHGTCGLAISNVRLKERIIMGIRALAEYYAEKIDDLV